MRTVSPVVLLMQNNVAIDSNVAVSVIAGGLEES